MASVVTRQQEFAQRHATIQPFWGQVEDLSILSAALLTQGINPSALDEEMDVYRLGCADHGLVQEAASAGVVAPLRPG